MFSNSTQQQQQQQQHHNKVDILISDFILGLSVLHHLIFFRLIFFVPKQKTSYQLEQIAIEFSGFPIFFPCRNVFGAEEIRQKYGKLGTCKQK